MRTSRPRLHAVDREPLVTGLMDDDEAPRGAPMVHPLAVQSWAVREIRTGRVTVAWSNAGGRREMAS